AFVDELAAIMEWAFAYMQRDGKEEPSKAAPSPRSHRDAKGGSVYLRLTTRAIEQPQRPMTRAFKDEIIDGAYWLRRPEPGTRVALVYTGAVAP
ncbi:hypothetical protein QR504_25530, partial [Escherichia coli]|uniref:hypothetical protein n=1 Tax=Escherichia coli TaxID=562 RepID=UPI00273A26CC